MKLPKLNRGEINAGLIMEDGKPHHWVILLPGDNYAKWQAAVDWAKSIGGELPSRREQRVLFANAKQAFLPTWYWSGELSDVSDAQCAWVQFFNGGRQSLNRISDVSDAQCAWVQLFNGGRQSLNRISDACRARAVRRVMIGE